MKNKRAIPSLVMALMVLSATSLAQIKVNVDGNPVAFTGTGPTKVGGRVLVPLRGVMEKLGATVEWTPSLQRIDANKGSTKVVLIIGQRNAEVNGNTVSLDVPAMIIGGSTMVPLRFVGEAIGAEVKWLADTNTVEISTGGSGGSGTGGGTGTATVEIDQFTHNAGGWVRAGQSVEFLLEGTRGAEAWVTLRGTNVKIPLREVAFGRYTGSWKPTAEALGGPLLEEARVMGFLASRSSERQIQAGSLMNIDLQKPQLRVISPVANSRVTPRARIEARFDDGAGSGLDAKSIQLLLNGNDLTSSASISNGLLRFEPRRDLPNGKYTVKVSAKDVAGNLSSGTWSFEVGAPSPIKSVTHDGSGSLQPGQVITFTVMATPKGKVLIELGDLFKRSAREVSPGKYVADYTVRTTDNLNGVKVTAAFTDSNGVVSRLAAPGVLGRR